MSPASNYFTFADAYLSISLRQVSTLAKDPLHVNKEPFCLVQLAQGYD